ncbi:DegT/DnrJ/EryC1/StrS family aminotransferase [Hufsiella ginkgonis]|uniref:Aminotransferase DegT n=1 Tax=Hufsiella ginkgonis TaxID=2695274 RepID=A0A7K1XTF4_9SPHI|nr:DegT/DnrJ/EryC1/StrS family aminotransferase [Hufsiella ginkgonis]MXV14244.1 aminotransferase DegT [Hufsiella ginkgonis]
MSVPVNIPFLNGNEKKYVNECIETGWISSEGPFVGEFEARYSRYCHRNHGIAVSSGSAALDVAVKALGISSGDEVIMPTFTIISPAFSLIRAAAVPVLVDSELTTWNMNVAEIEDKITARTKAILVVHIYGLPVDMNKIVHLAKKYDLLVIEDAAEMHGQTCHGRPCGSFGDISIFSFYANKNITTGEGGMILCNDDALAERCRKLRNLSFDPALPRFVHHEMGWNYRMTNMQAAMGLAQLEQIDDFIHRKRGMGRYYHDELSFLEESGYLLPKQQTAYADNIYWVFGLVAPSETEKEDLVAYLNKANIGTRPFFWCMHEQPVFASREFYKKTGFRFAERLARCGFYIPSGLGTTREQMGLVVEAIKGFYA